MKKSTKAILLAAVCAMTFLVCSCGTNQVTDSSSVADSETRVTKTGVVIDATMHTLTIAASDGSTYLYTMDDMTTFEGESENLGDTVSVTTVGEYTENAIAESVKVIAKAEAEVSVSATEVKEEAASENEKKDDQKESDKKDSKSEKKEDSSAVKYITAEVTDATMNQITVEWNGKEYNIKKDDKTSVEGNITVGSTVRIYHTGAIADGITAIDISAVAPEIVNKDIKYITGKVVDASMNAIVIENNGHQYSVKKDDDTKSDSVSAGDTVRVYHKGSYADGMTATSIVKQ